MNLSFVDVETTSLEPTGAAWEVAVLVYDPVERKEVERYGAMMPLPAGCHIDPASLSVGGFHDRHPRGNNRPTRGTDSLIPRWLVAERVSSMTHGTILAGLNVSFDEGFLRRLFAEDWDGDPVYPSWHYSTLDLKSAAAGKLGVIGDNFKSSELGEMLGIAPPLEVHRHTAMGDAEWAKSFYHAIFDTPQPATLNFATEGSKVG